MTWWAFGWRTMCVALAVFATNFPSRFYWTGGAFLRWDWLFYMVGGVCLVKKERPLLGGFFLGYSTLLRIFPLFIFFGPVLVIVRQLWGKVGEWPKPAPAAGAAPRPRPRRVTGRRRASGGSRSPGSRGRRSSRASIAASSASWRGPRWRSAILVPISLVTSNGIDGYRAFAFNTNKHKETPLTNYMGLRTVVIYSPSEAGRVHEGRSAGGSLGALEAARRSQTFHARDAALPAASSAASWCCSTRRLRDAEPWVACAMGAMMMAVGVELTCYYYSFLFAVTLLYYKRQRGRARSCWASTAMTGLIDWSPTRYLPDVKPWMDLKLSQWLDEQYMMMSLATLAGFVWILYRFAYHRRSRRARWPPRGGRRRRPSRRSPSTGASPRGAAAADADGQPSRRRRWRARRARGRRQAPQMKQAAGVEARRPLSSGRG